MAFVPFYAPTVFYFANSNTLNLTVLYFEINYRYLTKIYNISEFINSTTEFI